MFPYPKDSLSRFVFGSAATVIVLYLLWYGLKNPLTEGVDKVYFLAALVVGALAFVLRFPERAERALSVTGLTGFAIMVWGLLTVEHLSMVNTLWLGFGRTVTIATLVLIPLAGYVLRPSAAIARPYRLAGYALLVAVGLVGALSFIQTRTSLMQPNHSAYVFNEVYAAAAGHYPYTDFVPQYQTLFTYLFLPVISLLGPEQALNPVLVVFSALSLVTVGLGVLAGLMATRGLNRLLAPLVILPLVFITQGPGRLQWGGSISALHSAFPVRMLMPTLIGVVIALLPALGVQRWHPYRHALPLGVLIGLSCFHQVDFGLAAAVSVGALLLITEVPARLLRSLASYCGSVAAGFLAVPLLHWLAEKPLDAGKIGWFVRQFGGGFGSEPMQIPGPVLVVLPLLVGATVTCLAALRAQRAALRSGSWVELGLLNSLRPEPVADSLRPPAPDHALVSVQRAALLGSYFGVFAIAAFPYYLNRSYASGQLQILFLPLGVALCACAQIIAASPEWIERARSAKTLLFRFALAVPVASMVLLPSPRHELTRLGGEHSETHWPSEKTASVLAIGDAWKRLGSYETVGYWGNDGNYIQSMIGVRNVTRFNSPLDGSMSPAARKELCAGIDKLQTLILGELAPNPAICNSKWTFKKSKLGVVVAIRQREGDQPVAAR
jgi:hypothetical protein